MTTPPDERKDPLATYPRRTSYGIFVKFRRSRLALRRGIVRLEDALSLAEELRAGRFHDRGDIFVLKEPEGTVVAAPSPMVGGRPPDTPREDGFGLAGSPEPLTVGGKPPDTPRRDGFGLAGSPEPSTPPSVPKGSAGEANPVPPTVPGVEGANGARPPAETPPAKYTGHAGGHPQTPALPRASPAHELPDLLRLIAQAHTVRSTVDRARIAHARLERACQAMDHASQRHDAPPAVELRRNHERLLTLSTSLARSVESFERVALLVERRLEVAWAEATRRPAPGR